jgi:hypothetical protein
LNKFLNYIVNELIKYNYLDLLFMLEDLLTGFLSLVFVELLVCFVELPVLLFKDTPFFVLDVDIFPLVGEVLPKLKNLLLLIDALFVFLCCPSLSLSPEDELV